MLLLVPHTASDLATLWFIGRGCSVRGLRHTGGRGGHGESLLEGYVYVCGRDMCMYVICINVYVYTHVCVCVCLGLSFSRIGKGVVFLMIRLAFEGRIGGSKQP